MGNTVDFLIDLLISVSLVSLSVLILAGTIALTLALFDIYPPFHGKNHSK